jgi:hypothetical protein
VPKGQRDPGTIDLFTGEVDPGPIPKSKSLVARPKKAAEQPATSVPSVPAAATSPAPLVPQPADLKTAAPAQPAPDNALFHHTYLIVLAVAWMCTGIEIADNLYDVNIVGSLINSRVHITVHLDQYLLAAVRGTVSFVVAFITFVLGCHIAVRPTTLAPGRYAMAVLFIGTAVLLALVAYICEHDYMWQGLSDIVRRLCNIARMHW